MGKVWFNCHQETLRDNLNNGSAAMDDDKVFRRDRQKTKGGKIALYVRERFDCLGLNGGGNKVDCLQVRIRRKTNKADMVRLC